MIAYFCRPFVIAHDEPIRVANDGEFGEFATQKFRQRIISHDHSIATCRVICFFREFLHQP